jgi:hypothetical protein
VDADGCDGWRFTTGEDEATVREWREERRLMMTMMMMMIMITIYGR